MLIAAESPFPETLTAATGQPNLARSLLRLRRRLGAILTLCPDLPVTALFWLYIKHPLHPVQEKLLGEMDAACPTGTTRGKRVAAGLRCLAYALYLGQKIIRLRWVLRSQRRALARQSFPMLAKTWGFSAELARKPSDFYFGGLQKRLMDRNVPMLLLCGNAGSLDAISFGKAYASAVPPFRLPELCLLQGLDPLWMALRQIIASVKLTRLAFRAKDSLLRRALGLAALDSLAPQTLRDALYSRIAQTACRTWRPKAFLTLYEGHAWEKCAWRGAKIGHPGCRTVGYQHTVLFQESLAMTRPPFDRTSRFVPDAVAGTGDIPLDLLRPSHEPQGCSIVRLGSFRYQEGRASEPGDPVRRWILVTPEGMLPETKALFEFAARGARTLPGAVFVIRTHPALPIEQVLPQLPQDFLRLPNVMVSQEKEISADFRRCSFLLYRGSSTVLYSILQGLRPICLRVPGMIDTDPLYDLKSWRLHCSTPEELAALIERDGRLALEDRRAQWLQASAYVTRYTRPVDDQGVDRLLQATGLSGRLSV
jgi:hypothetical protein